MQENEKPAIRIAILDLYNGIANEGMRCIRQIIEEFSLITNIPILYTEFEVRVKKEIPDLSFDIYISSGGPGSPLESEEADWEKAYFKWIYDIEEWNHHPSNIIKKNVFFICHSFQLACRYYNIGNVCKRKSTAFGVFPVHLLATGKDEIIFKDMRDPVYGVDSRDYQVIEPNNDLIEENGAILLAIEKERPHVPLERAIMAVRFNEYMVGTQFHPEADANGMSMYLQREDKKQTVIDNHGEAKWQSMIDQLNDPDKIMFTYSHILPNFLDSGITKLRSVQA